jgi:uncharacterized membrane protein YjjP (DUF1212 family)
MIAAAKALHRFGAPAHRLESTLEGLAGRLDLEVGFFCTPTAIMISVGPEGDARTTLLRVDPPMLDLGRLADVDHLLGEVVRGELSMAAAERAIARVFTKRGRYGRALTLLSYGSTSGAAAIFFGGGVFEMFAATAAGMAVGALAFASKRYEGVAALFDPLGTGLAATIAFGLAHVLPLDPSVVTLAAVIVLVPGLTLTTAMTELATGHLTAGTARVARACVTFTTMAIGGVLGASIGQLAGPASTATPLHLPTWALAPSMLVAALTFGVLFQVRRRDMGWVVLATAVAYSGGLVGTAMLGPLLGGGLGAFVLAVGSNALANWRHMPASVTLVPGILMLVPGAIGFRGLTGLMHSDVDGGLQLAVEAVIASVALAAGVLTANVMLPTRR